MAFGLLAPVVLVACGTDDADHVAITSCTSDPTNGFPTAGGTVTNQGGEAASYEFNLVWKGTAPKAEISRAEIYLERVGPGEIVPWEAKSTLNPVSPLICELSDQRAKGLHLGHVGGPDVTRAKVP